MRYFRFVATFQPFTTGMDKSCMASNWMLATLLKFWKNVAHGTEAHAHESHGSSVFSPNHSSIWKMQIKPIQSFPNARKCCENGRKYGSDYMW